MSRALTAIAAGSAVIWLAWANGGYFPSEWGIGIVAAGLVCLGAIAVRDRIEVSRRDVLFVGALTALAVWAALSSLWTTADGPAISEAERGLLYATVAAALLLTVDRARVPALLGGLLGGVTVVVSYGLATRLYPGDVGGAYDPSSGYQLAEPLGYWNALGALAAIALLLGLGLARTSGAAARIAAGVSLVPLCAALYFTFSRGSVVALACGLAILIAVERNRIRAIVECGALAVAPVTAVWLCSGNRALTAPGATLQTAQAQGHELTRQLAFAAILSGLVALALPRVTRRLRPGRRAGRAAAAVAAGGAVLVLAAGLAAVGGPVATVTRVTDAFREEPEETDGDLNRRLLSVSGHGRADYWRVTLEMTGSAPIVGTGAGTFERTWLERRKVAHHARDAHSLYLETLGELGLVGLAILLVGLAVPFTALRVARAHPLGATASAGAVVFVVHAGVDWDWEVPALTMPALACGASLVVLGREGGALELTGIRRVAAIAAAISVVAAGLIIHAGNRAAAAGADALTRGDLDAAADDARRARMFQPWSAEPWVLLGDALLAAGHDRGARAAYREATDRDPGSWAAWLGLALSDPSNGVPHLDRARSLNPLSSDIAELEAEFRTNS